MRGERTARINSTKLYDAMQYLVFRKGIIIPAAVATSSSTTCSTVSTTLISFTTSARAFELSMPSTVTYCCCDMCSIFDICGCKTRGELARSYQEEARRSYTTYPCLAILQHLVDIAQTFVALILHLLLHIGHGLFQILDLILLESVELAKRLIIVRN